MDQRHAWHVGGLLVLPSEAAKRPVFELNVQFVGVRELAARHRSALRGGPQRGSW